MCHAVTSKPRSALNPGLHTTFFIVCMCTVLKHLPFKQILDTGLVFHEHQHNICSASSTQYKQNRKRITNVCVCAHVWSIGSSIPKHFQLLATYRGLVGVPKRTPLIADGRRVPKWAKMTKPQSTYMIDRISTWYFTRREKAVILAVYMRVLGSQGTGDWLVGQGSEQVLQGNFSRWKPSVVVFYKSGPEVDP